MKVNALTVHVRMDARIFRRFALFDTFIRQRKWKAPVLFLAIFVAFSAVAFASGSASPANSACATSSASSAESSESSSGTSGFSVSA